MTLNCWLWCQQWWAPWVLWQQVQCNIQHPEKLKYNSQSEVPLLVPNKVTKKLRRLCIGETLVFRKIARKDTFLNLIFQVLDTCIKYLKHIFQAWNLLQLLNWHKCIARQQKNYFGVHKIVTMVVLSPGGGSWPVLFVRCGVWLSWSFPTSSRLCWLDRGVTGLTVVAGL